MLPMTSDALASLDGTRVRERIKVDAYLGDRLTRKDLTVASWSLSWDATRKVQCSGTVTVADPDGELSPWEIGDVLGPGSRLQATWVCEDGSLVPRAMLVITQPEPETAWRIYHGGGTERWVPSGGVVTCTVEDTSLLAVRDQLQAAQSAQHGTVIAEVKRLLSGIIPVVTTLDDNVQVSSDTVYEKDRLDAVDDLLEHASLLRRIDGSGVIHLIESRDNTAPVWDVRGGDRGALVSMARTMKLDDYVSSVVATSSGGQQDEYVGRAYLTTGVSRWGGPIGNHTEFYSSPLITSQGAAESAAQTRLKTLTSDRSVELDVTCVPHPGLELHDRVSVMVPTLSGKSASITGRVTGFTLGGDSNGLNSMTMTVTCSRDTLAEIIRADRMNREHSR